jgi:hypothetical protein
MEGWIKLHRQLLENFVFSNPTTLKIWIWLLLKATNKKRVVSLKIGIGFQDVILEPGELIFGRFKAEEELNIDGSTIYKHIKKLEDVKNITIKSNNHYSVITICNWADYQESEIEKEQQSNNRVTTEEHKQERKKDNNILNNILNNTLNNTWKTDFYIYKTELDEACKSILTPEYFREREKYHPGLNIRLTLEKAYKDYWSREAGWKHKKATRTKTIDWESTFNNTLTLKMNQVWKSKLNEQSDSEPKKGKMIIYNTDGSINENDRI